MNHSISSLFHTLYLTDAAGSYLVLSLKPSAKSHDMLAYSLLGM